MSHASGFRIAASLRLAGRRDLECAAPAGTFTNMSATATCEGVARALALETSGRVGSLAAFRSERGQLQIIASQPLPGDKRSAQTLLPALGELLRACGWRADELELIATTTGPGSFTGLRIGVTTAKTLAYATGAKLVGVHTLTALATAVDTVSNRVWAILDAQRQELFAAVFVPGWKQQDEFAPQTRVISQDQWLAELLPGDIVIGPPLDKLSGRLPAGVKTASPELWQPSATAVASLGARALARGQTVDPMQLMPHYFRPSAAEEKAAANPT